MNSKEYKAFTKDGSLTDPDSESLEPSEELKELFKGMMKENPEERMTVSQILSSNWMMKTEEVPDDVEIYFATNEVIKMIIND
jgi:hypothetical protein